MQTKVKNTGKISQIGESNCDDVAIVNEELLRTISEYNSVCLDILNRESYSQEN